MVVNGELKDVFVQNRERYTQVTALITEEDRILYEQFYEEFKEVVCPLEDTTLEEFFGYMIVAGINKTQRLMMGSALKAIARELTGNV